MGAVQLPDELRVRSSGRSPRVTPRVQLHSLKGRYSVWWTRRRLEQEDLHSAVQAGLADIEAGRYTFVATPEDDRRLDERLMARLRERLAAEE
jgi:hypothetical protein